MKNLGTSKNLSSNSSNEHQILIVKIGKQLFGMPVINISDILGRNHITNIPLAPPKIAGSLNLRGRIVTAIDIKVILGMEHTKDFTENMSIVTEYQGELYSLIVDNVFEVINITANQVQSIPDNLTQLWRDLSIGVYETDSNLIILVDFGKLLNLATKTALE